MAIEFRCPQCNKLLRTADNTAGKQAKCPQCGAVAAIPAAGQASNPLGAPPPPPLDPLAGSGNPFNAPLGPPPSPGGDPFGAGGLGGLSGAFDPKMTAPGGFGPGGVPPLGGAGGDNPYQSPMFAAQGYQPSHDQGPRSGPAWERDRPSVGSYIQTIKDAFSDVNLFYGSMRREGGLGAPLGFAVIGTVLATIVGVMFGTAINAALGGAQDGARGMGMMLGSSAVSGAFQLVAQPIGAVIGLFIGSGIQHLFLMMLGGANYPYETTFRTSAYTSGIGSIIQLVPVCGGCVALVVIIAFNIIGLAAMHETTGWKAAGAVLLPGLLCLILIVVPLFMLVGFGAFAAANAGNANANLLMF